MMTWVGVYLFFVGFAAVCHRWFYVSVSHGQWCDVWTPDNIQTPSCTDAWTVTDARTVNGLSAFLLVCSFNVSSLKKNVSYFWCRDCVIYASSFSWLKVYGIRDGRFDYIYSLFILWHHSILFYGSSVSFIRHFHFWKNIFMKKIFDLVSKILH